MEQERNKQQRNKENRNKEINALVPYKKTRLEQTTKT